jgi:hypothetical protein
MGAVGHLPKHDDGTAVIVIEVDAFGYLATCDGKKDGPTSIITCLREIDESDAKNGERNHRPFGSFLERCWSRLHPEFPQK